MSAQHDNGNGNGRSITAEMAARYGMAPAPFEATLRATVVPANTSREEFAAFLIVAREFGLNPITKEIYAYPKRGGGIQPIVGIDGWTNIVNSHPAFDGMEFADTLDDKGNVTAITCRIYRKDRQHATEATEYLAECAQGTEPWRKWPRRMLRHKALIQCARYAFSFAGIIDPDEYQRRPAEAVDVTPKQTLREKLTAIAAPRPAEVTTYDAETGEIDAGEAIEEPAAEEVVDETEVEVEIDPTSKAYQYGVRDARDGITACGSQKILENPVHFANWRAGWSSVQEEAAA